jgi:hypothetical protein
MSWQGYELTYEARAPVLLGDHPLGFIQRTRTYAAGWTLWGAITARLTRARLARAEGADYQAVGRFVMENLPTSYAHLLVRDEQAGIADEPARPRYDRQGRLRYGPLSAAGFEARFLASLGQTAVAPATLTAEVGALHETEVLTAYDQKTREPARWRFTLYAAKRWPELPAQLRGLTIEDVLEALETLTLGADRSYGLGRLERVEAGAPLDAGDGERPRPLSWDDGTLHAHVPLRDVPGDRVRGRAVAIPWRWWENDSRKAWGPGQRPSVRIFYAPGSRVDRADWTPAIGRRGVWRMREDGHEA